MEWRPKVHHERDTANIQKQCKLCSIQCRQPLMLLCTCAPPPPANIRWCYRRAPSTPLSHRHSLSLYITYSTCTSFTSMLFSLCAHVGTCNRVQAFILVLFEHYLTIFSLRGLYSSFSLCVLGRGRLHAWVLGFWQHHNERVLAVSSSTRRTGTETHNTL